MDNIAKRLRGSLGMDAVNGDAFERSVCARQMREAADEIDRLNREINLLNWRCAELEDENASLERDSYRYRWVRDGGYLLMGSGTGLGWPNADEVDSAVDAALAARSE